MVNINPLEGKNAMNKQLRYLMLACPLAVTALAVSTIAFGGAASAQGIDFSSVEIKTVDLGRNTYRLEGQGGNITVAVGTDGIIMVDGQFAPLHDKIKAAIAAISPQPIKYLINTHFHGDHTGGNAGFQNEVASPHPGVPGYKSRHGI